MSINSKNDVWTLATYIRFYKVQWSYLKISFLILFFIIFKNYQIFGAGNYTCTLTTSNLVFSAFNPYDATFETTNGLVRVKCVSNGSVDTVTYTVTVSGGGSGNQTARLVVNGVNSVSYNLYKDSGYTQILGDGNSSTSTITNTYTLGQNASRTDNYTIYGKIPVQPLAKPMTYTDTITATLNY